MKKLFCKLFGHNYGDVEIMVHIIKRVGINKDDFLEDKLICKRCGQELQTNN